MKRDVRHAIMLFVSVTMLVALCLWVLTQLLHVRWLREMSTLAGQETLTARGYHQEIGPFFDPTFIGIAGFMRVLILVSAPVSGTLAATIYLWLRRLRLRDEIALAEWIEGIIRGDATQTDGISLLQQKTNQLSTAMAEGRCQAELEREGVKRLVNDISHQLKTPVAALRLHSELLEEPGLTELERNTLLNHLKAQTLRIDSLIQSLVYTARLESGAIQIEAIPQDLAATVRSAMDVLVLKASAKCIKLDFDGMSPLIVPHDREWTQEAIVNVIDNAIKYTPEGGNVKIGLSFGASYARIDVEDNGYGLANGELSQVFGRFFRGSAAKTESAEGSGLGLHITSEILRRQGGAITAEHIQSGGVRFSLFLQNR